MIDFCFWKLVHRVLVSPWGQLTTRLSVEVSILATKCRWCQNRALLHLCVEAMRHESAPLNGKRSFRIFFVHVGAKFSTAHLFCWGVGNGSLHLLFMSSQRSLKWLYNTVASPKLVWTWGTSENGDAPKTIPSRICLMPIKNGFYHFHYDHFRKHPRKSYLVLGVFFSAFSHHFSHAEIGQVNCGRWLIWSPPIWQNLGGRDLQNGAQTEFQLFKIVALWGV